MKLPRISIAWVMEIVILVAVDLAAFRAAFRAANGTTSLPPIGTLIGVLVVYGAMPMASILVFGIPTLIKMFRRNDKSRPFLMGFEAAGWEIVLTYTVASVLSPFWVAGNLELLAGEVVQLIPASMRESIVVVMLLMLLIMLPQLAVALMGGWFNWKFKISITVERRRTAGVEANGPSPAQPPTAKQSLGSFACR